MVKDLLGMNEEEMDYESLDLMNVQIFEKMCMGNIEFIGGKEVNSPVLDDLFETVNEIFGPGTVKVKEDLVLYLSSLC